ncbi:hypothetical protein M8997_003335 [Phyllobacterium sp. 21LDTY02-6]|jgi:hypothetical protein|uniref:hypothetical protein n=1 Tax=unclassified Phyllobacterium TaxID=2638441 RepID=UPI0020221AA4|nr:MULTISPECIES: hypothetical protein [unclassified Phyllobacterium]MCO4316207.1 hypothetical protein [Phyllobacterium sp. 21LDTY02-6]MCX8279370.1 hypothetical protein [Phyllobacterium sp. 0TCS1.6C]MCX8292439.1 hypothetical protein [Phyllobacterium sp. 0TCS1.6A]
MKTSVAAAALSLFACSLMAMTAHAKDKDAEFFQTIEGQWVGPGEIVAGKYKGTKFTCTLDGSTPTAATGMTLDGNCRVGIFNQPMKATVVRTGNSYKGSFLDGSAGKGLDITGGNVSGNRVVLAISRKQLSGAMQAKMTGDNSLNVTISVRLEDQMIPVVGMSLKRVDETAVGSIAKN